MGNKSFIEVQFPIGPLSLESYNERRVSHGKVLSLGKWWGEKPLVLTRAIILGAVFPAADDPERWPDDLDIFLKCLCLDNAGMWKRKTERLPSNLCFEYSTEEERQDFFADDGQWLRATKANALAAAKRAGKEMPDPTLSRGGTIAALPWRNGSSTPYPTPNNDPTAAESKRSMVRPRRIGQKEIPIFEPRQPPWENWCKS